MLENHLELLLSLLVTLAGGIMAYATLRSNSTENTRRITAMEAQIVEAEKDAAAFKLKVSEEYVKNTAVEKLEGRFANLIEGALKPMNETIGRIEHNMRGVEQKLDQRIMSMVNFSRLARNGNGGKDAE